LVRFCVFADAHVGRSRLSFWQWDYWFWLFKKKEIALGPFIEERLEKTVEQLNCSHDRNAFDFVIDLGDTTESGLLGQFIAAGEILEKLKTPCVSLNGNHDLCFLNPEYQGGLFENYAFIFKGVRFVIVDNVNRFSWRSKMHFQSQKWLELQIECAIERDEKKIVIFSHAPINKRFLKINGLEVIHICGHTHRWRIRTQQGLVTCKIGALYLKPQVLECEINQNYHWFFEKAIS